ncbi:MAG: hypothetical protein Q8910_00690 [Bacteroidota bacterium]|nr:hypothetical protein [Bacteroidota bacterium]
MRAIFSIDCDGTLFKEDWPNIGEPFQEAIKALREIKRLGHYIILNTCRQGILLEEVLAFMKRYDIPYDYANENIPDKIALFGDCRKIGADVFVDDRNIGKWTWIDVLEKARQLAWEK